MFNLEHKITVHVTKGGITFILIVNMLLETTRIIQDFSPYIIKQSTFK